MTDIDLITQAQRSKAPKDVIQAFLVNSGKDSVQQAAEALVAEDATYISLNFDNPELERIEPWTGTRKGRQIYIDTFSNVGTYWEVNDFQVSDVIADGELVAVFGQFTYTSVEVGHRFTSPFAIKARVENGLITFFQFMEDTYASARSFRKSGSWEIQNNGRRFQVG
ncbi:MAG: nuclear transport factor 2 family protein [Stenotrophomonas sp.]